MIKKFFQIFHFMPSWVLYKSSSNEILYEELKQWCKSLRVDCGSEFRNFLFLMTLPEYRTELYWRLGSKSWLVKIICPPHPVLYISTASNRVGKGFIIEHGHSTIVHATSIGENFHVWQNVTIGKEKPGGTKPTIGNNVYIYTGSVVIGDIRIGDNVVIGANSVVTKSIPDNCTVVGNPAMIIKREGKRVFEKL